MCISAKDHIGKERATCHIAGYLQGLKPIPQGHNILPGQNYAARTKRSGQWCTIFRADSLKDAETGKFVYSACPQSKVLVRGALYDLTEIFVTCPDFFYFLFTVIYIAHFP